MRKFVLSLFIISAHLLLWCAAQQLPGFKTTVSQRGLTYFKDVGIAIMEMKLDEIVVPTINGDVNTPIGAISYVLSDMKFSSLNLPESSITLLPEIGVALSISNTTAFVSMNWTYREDSWPHMSDHGSANIYVAETYINVTIPMGEVDGKPFASVGDCSAQIGHLDVNFEGGSSWLYNIFADIFAKQLKGALEQALAYEIRVAINEGSATALDSLPVVEQISDDVEIDYSMVDYPTFTESYFTFPLKGAFYQMSEHTESPFVPSPLPDSLTDEMVQMFIDDFLPNSAGYAYFKANRLQVSFTDDDLPTDAPLRLNTTYFIDMVPPLYKAFPDQLMEIDSFATQPPIVVFSKEGAFVEALGNLNVYILPQRQLAFTLFVHMFCSGSAGLDGLNITGKLKFMNASFSLQSSNIGDFDVSTLEDVVNFVLKQGAIPMANELLSAGISLPTIEGLDFVNPVIGWADRYLYISTDITYNPEFFRLKLAETQQLPQLEESSPRIGPNVININ